MNHDENPTPKVEEIEEAQQPTMTFTVEFVDVDEQATEWGGRYKRPGAQPRPRSRDRALNKGEYGKVEDLQAVFDSRAAYFQENPKPETYQEINEDSRALGHVLPDFPGVHDFVFEMQTARWKALDRLVILQETQNRLEALSHQLTRLRVESEELARKDKAGELEKGELTRDIRKFKSAAKKAQQEAENYLEKLRNNGAQAEKFYSMNEIAAIAGISRPAMSQHAKSLRDRGRIKTGPRQKLPETDKEILLRYAKSISQPGRRKRKGLPRITRKIAN